MFLLFDIRGIIKYIICYYCSFYSYRECRTNNIWDGEISLHSHYKKKRSSFEA